MANTHETLMSLFSDIADSIRNKTGENRVLVADDFPDEIDAIETGGQPQPEPLPPDTPYVWTRPSNYPDLDSLTYPNDANEMYVTIDKTLDPSVTSISVTSSGGAFYFGHISNGEFVADTGDIQGTSIDITQYSGDILLGKLVVGTSISINTNNVFAESYVNVNNSSVTNRSIFKGQKIKHINVKAYKISATDMSQMFSGCNSLQQLDLSNFDTSLVTSMSQMFSGCNRLQQLDLSNFDTSLVTSMSQMFSNCNRLQQLELSNFDTSSVTNMSTMFSTCNSLQQLDLSSFDTSSVTDMSYMFSYCRSLQQLDLSNFDTSLVTSMSSMFSGCNSLQQLDLSNFDTSLVTSMSSMFQNCYALKIAEPFQSTLTASQVTSLFTSSGLFKRDCIYRSTYLSWCEVIPEGTGTIYIASALNYKLSDADRALLTDKGYTLSIS